MSSRSQGAHKSQTRSHAFGITHVRVKRQHTTFLITVDLGGGSKPEDVKEKLEELVKRPAEEQRLILKVDDEGSENKSLEDGGSLVEQGVENDAVIYLVLKNGDEWEEIDVPEFPSMTS